MGKPSKGTPKDKRLKANKKKAAPAFGAKKAGLFKKGGGRR